MFEVKGKTFFITGAGSGLGFVYAKYAGTAGAKVILNGRNTEKLNTSVARLRKDGIDAFGYDFDVSDAPNVEHKINLIVQEHGCPDVLVNNAGINIRSQFEEVRVEDWKKVLDIDLTGIFLISKYIVHHMKKKHSGKIINICSMLSELGRESTSAYAAAKGGVKMLTKAMATDLGKYNIQVNGIGPGYFCTEMTQQLYDDKEFNKWICSRVCLNRWGQPEELVGTLLFLASDASNYITGQIIYVDGGLLAKI